MIWLINFNAISQDPESKLLVCNITSLKKHEGLIWVVRLILSLFLLILDKIACASKYQEGVRRNLLMNRTRTSACLSLTHWSIFKLSNQLTNLESNLIMIFWYGKNSLIHIKITPGKERCGFPTFICYTTTALTSFYTL